MFEFIQNHPIITIGWVGCLIGIIVTFVQDKMLGVKEIGNSLVGILTNKEKGYILDLRPYDQFKKGHITGSHHLTLADIAANNLGKIAEHKDKPVILVNENGLNLLDPAKQLKALGFSQLYILKEGINGWSMDNLVLVKK